MKGVKNGHSRRKRQQSIEEMLEKDNRKTQAEISNNYTICSAYTSFFRFCFEENSHYSEKTSTCSQQKKLFLHLHETQMQVERKKNMYLLQAYFGVEAVIKRRAIKLAQLLHIILNVSYSLVRDAHTYSGLLNLHTISTNSID